MSDLHFVALKSTVETPWRNGGGVTRDLLSWPLGGALGGALAGDWQLRVTVASIDRDGPFSPFPGVARCFNVLSGDGVRLRFADRTLELRCGDAPLAFDGADAPGCALLGGATRDLNLMARSGAGTPRMQLAEAGSGISGVNNITRWRGLYAAAPARIFVDGEQHSIAADTLVWSDSAAPSLWQLESASVGQAWWLTLGS